MSFVYQIIQGLMEAMPLVEIRRLAGRHRKKITCNSANEKLISVNNMLLFV